ncbi:MAG: hypothetical protein HYV76_01100 [Candidatus Vogelbacteria bacterium]|nr:hypothetical protein [Candidatus Vogelbacteria bacterium]
MIRLKNKTLLIFRWAPPVAGGPNCIYHLFSRFSPTDYCILTNYKNTHSGNLTNNWLPANYYYYDKWSLLKTGFFKRITQAYQLINGGYRLIKQEHVDLIFSVSDGGHSFLTGLTLSIITGRPLAIYLLDLYKDNYLPRRQKIIAWLIEPIIFYWAIKIIVTNEGTREFYLRRYPRLDFEIIYNSTDFNQYQKQITLYNPISPYSIVFTGHLYWAQRQSIENLIQAVIETTELEITLTLYVLNPPADLVAHYINNPKIIFTKAPQEKMPEIQTKADILFLPLAWETPSPAIIQTATPGKLTDYLASGRPILVHAPDYAYVSRFSHKHGLATVVDQNNIDLLKKAIKKILTDQRHSQATIVKAQDTFHRLYNAEINAQKLADIINHTR